MADKEDDSNCLQEMKIGLTVFEGKINWADKKNEEARNASRAQSFFCRILFLLRQLVHLLSIIYVNRRICAKGKARTCCIFW
jgi:hypothetical protein